MTDPPMRLACPAFLIASCVLAACQGPGTAPRVGASKPPRVASTPASPPSASASPAEVPAPPASAPAGVASAPASPPTVAFAALVRPAGDVRTLTGAVAIDARYAVAAGGGQLISDKGASLLAVGRALAPGVASALIANNGGGAIANNGGGVIANNGSGLIANHGGGLIANNGGGALPTWDAGSGPLRFALLGESAQAAPGAMAALPAFGEIAPVAGMAVRVFDPATHRLLDLGLDAQGAPVREVVTGAGGRFEVYLPKTASPNLLVLARVPDSPDERLHYVLVAPPTPLADTLDEDAAEATRYVRLAYVQALRPYLRPFDPTATVPPWIPPTDLPAFRAAGAKLREALAAAGADKLDPDVRQVLLLRMADAVLADADVARARVDRAHADAPYEGPDEGIFAAYVGMLKRYREIVTARMRELEAGGQDPATYFAGRPYVQALNATRRTPWVIKKPLDYVNMVALSYFGDPQQPPTLDADQLETTLAGSFGDVLLPPDELKRHEAADRGIAISVDRTVFLGDGKALDALIAVVTAK